MASRTTLIDELAGAARGFIALVTGDRRAPGHFDFSPRGLAGSFIALIVAEIAVAYGPLLFGFRPEPGAITRLLIMVAIGYVAQLACVALVLRQVGRLDGLSPYLVADNWASFFLTLATAVMGSLGGDPAMLIVIAIVVLILQINIARLIVTLSALQVAMFVIAQLVGASIAWLIIRGLFPMEVPPVAA